jgi:uncharacterized protein (TIGR02646 family)
MKNLDRVASPTCLQGKIANRTWNVENIWRELDKMQNGFCAYCERKLNSKKHIEHFKAKRDDNRLEFEWNNLFGSCGNPSKPWSSCGIFKDSKKGRPYSTQDLIKPDKHNPELYLFFSSTGKVKPRPNLNPRDLKLAKETIRVFNLNNDISLFGARRKALKVHLDLITDLIEYDDYGTKENLIELIKEYQELEFSAALNQLSIESL